MLDKPVLSETMRSELPPSFLDIYDDHIVGGFEIPGDFFIEHMATLKKHGIYEQLLLYEYVEGEKPILDTKVETLHKAFSACNREKLRELCEDMPDERSEYTVYRGASEERKLGISWTLCQLHATYFSCLPAMADKGRLYKTTVSAPNVLAFFGRYFNESEMILVPQHENVSELPILPEVREMMNEYYVEEFDCRDDGSKTLAFRRHL